MQNIPGSNEVPSISDMLKLGIRDGSRPNLTVSSNSMAPLLQRGDKVMLHSFSPDHLNSGQIITFAFKQYPHDIITHRFAGFVDYQGEVKIATWADRTLMFDNLLDVDDIIGRVVCRERGGKKLYFENGRGAWLSTKLYNLACWELLTITKLDLKSANLNLETIALSDSRRKIGKQNFKFRLLRRLISYWAKLLSLTVHTLTKKNEI